MIRRVRHFSVTTASILAYAIGAIVAGATTVASAAESSDGRCGPDVGGASCPASQCCSDHGWCGTDPHCTTSHGYGGQFDGPQPAPAPPADVAAAPADPDVQAPDAVVAEDPTIPLHEAVVGTPYMAPEFAAPTAAPEPVVEDRPAQPDPSNVWIDGYWWWSSPLARYVWVAGVWRAPPPDQTWTPGAWVNNGANQFIWSPGEWDPTGTPPDTTVLTTAPPDAADEAAGAPPDPAAVWMPGFFIYAGGTYTWTSGSWGHASQPGLTFVPARYAFIGGRYHYQRGRWDRPVERRGTVYRADVNVKPKAHLTLSSVPTNLVAAHASYLTASAKVVSHGGVVKAGAPVRSVAREIRRSAPGAPAPHEMKGERGAVGHVEPSRPSHEEPPKPPAPPPRAEPTKPAPPPPPPPPPPHVEPPPPPPPPHVEPPPPHAEPPKPPPPKKK